MANGISDDLPLDLARDVVQILMETGRATHPGPWVERLRREAMEALVRSLPENMI